jgi:hypothetical protein
VTVPTWRGWAVLVAIVGGCLGLALFRIHPFLAVMEPAGQGLLVVPGWIHDDAVPDVLSRFDEGDYLRIVTTGGALTRGTFLAQQHASFAELAAETLIEAGLPAEDIQPIPTPAVARDRTYASAVAVRQWLDDSDISVDRLDVLSAGAHARRSRLLFQMAMGPGIKVGIIAVPPTGYDADAWWRSSAGVRTVISETIAYLYAKGLFWP